MGQFGAGNNGHQKALLCSLAMALDAGDIEGLRAKYGDNREIGKPRALPIPKSSSPRLRSSLRKILRGLPFKRLKSPQAF